VLAPLKPVQDKLYDEIVARIKQDDASVPYRERGWWYYSRFEAGKDYPIHARRKDAAGIDAARSSRPTRPPISPAKRCCWTSTRWRPARTTTRSAGAR
jgi:hypothetical protein